MKRMTALLLSMVAVLLLAPAVAVALGPVHVGDLDASSASSPRNRWSATVIVTVHDGDELPVAGATVSGSWSGLKGSKKKANPSGSCVTDVGGQCSITLNNVKKNTASVVFTIDAIAHSAGTYASEANHDPDADSDGTTIAVPKP